jgi:tetratricopeptide (TPR) repeat protein
MKKRKTSEATVSTPDAVDIPAQTGTRKKIHRFLESPEFHIFALIILALLAYSNTFKVPFLFDDEGSIQLNRGVHGISNFLDGGFRFLPNRVLSYLSFALNYQLSGLDVTSYHIVNLIIHIINAQLVYALTRLTLSTHHLKRTFSEAQIGLFAFIVALLFVSHPVQTQAVTYIVQRLTSLCALLYLTSLVCYIRWRLDYTESASFLRGIASPWFAFSFVAAILAMKTKEIAFTLPVIILLYEYTFFGWPVRKLLGQMVPLLMTAVIIPYTVFTIQSGGALLSDVTSPAYNIARVTRWEYLYTQFSVILTYLRLLILPVRQTLDYDYPLNHSLAEPKTFISLLALLLLFSLAVYLFFKSNRGATPAGEEKEGNEPTQFTIADAPFYRLAAFGIFWFFITLSVESSIITIQDVIFEHRLYLPSYGFFLFMVSTSAIGLNKLSPKIRDIRSAATSVAVILVVVLASATFARNSVWHDWPSIWGDTVKNSPDKPRPRLILGIGHFYLGQMKEALQEYQQAIKLKPDYIEAYYNIGLVHKSLNQHKEAIAMFQKALAMTAFEAGFYAKVYNEIGISYAEIKELDKAIDAFARAVKFREDSTEYRNNFAFALQSIGNMDDSLREYQTVLKANPADTHAAAMVEDIQQRIKAAAGSTR